MELKVAFLAIHEHGDCSVITIGNPPNLNCIVIDGGESNNGAAALRAYLNKSKINTIDLMIGTHLDSDHINGLKLFVQAEASSKKNNKPFIDIKNYWGPLPYDANVPKYALGGGSASSMLSPTQQYMVESIQQNEDLLDAIREIVPTGNICFPSRKKPPKPVFTNIDLKLLGPDDQVPSSTFESRAMALGQSISGGPIIQDGMDLSDLGSAINNDVEALAQQLDRTINNQSIVVRLKPAQGNQDWSFLFTGDATQEAWRDMDGDPQVKPLLKAKVLKVPHHGSSLNGITKEGVDAVSPDYSVIMVGNKHGLPNAPTLALLRGIGSKILCTQKNSDPKHKNACYSVPKAKCPAKDIPKDIIFTIDTVTGSCTIEPTGRACLNQW